MICDQYQIFAEKEPLFRAISLYISSKSPIIVSGCLWFNINHKIALAIAGGLEIPIVHSLETQIRIIFEFFQISTVVSFGVMFPSKTNPADLSRKPDKSF